MRDLRRPLAAAEIFASANFAFLAVDIFLAHSVNRFSRWEEWIPFVFSLAAAPLVAGSFVLGGDRALAATPRQRLGRAVGLAAGMVSVIVGIAGLILHLDSVFFERQTLAHLVYTAPFAAPLAYTGLGLLLLLDRLVESEREEWAKWVVFLSLGGFIGNVALSLADHAQNGFFYRTEWIAVGAAAVAVGFLASAILVRPGRRFLRVCLSMMAIEAGVGVLGFTLHLRGNLARPARSVWDRFLYGAPVFAPLLFANLAVLAAIGLWGWLDARRFALQDPAVPGLLLR